MTPVPKEGHNISMKQYIAHLRPTPKPYTRQPKHNKGLTLVVQYEENSDEVAVHIAKVHKSDSYSKKTGVSVALSNPPIKVLLKRQDGQTIRQALWELSTKIGELAKNHLFESLPEKISQIGLPKDVVIQAPLISLDPLVSPN